MDSMSNAKWGLVNGQGIDGKLDGICTQIECIEIELVLMEYAKTEKAQEGLMKNIRKCSDSIVTLVGWVREDLEISEKFLKEEKGEQ